MTSVLVGGIASWIVIQISVFLKSEHCSFVLFVQQEMNAKIFHCSTFLKSSIFCQVPEKYPVLNLIVFTFYF